MGTATESTTATPSPGADETRVNASPSTHDPTDATTPVYSDEYEDRIADDIDSQTQAVKSEVTISQCLSSIRLKWVERILIS